MLENMFFCFKIKFPWKEQWQNQRRQVFGGAEKNTFFFFVPKVLKCGESQAPHGAWLPGLGQSTRLTACRELCGCHLGLLEALVQSIPGAVFRRVSLCCCLPVAFPESAAEPGITGVVLDVRDSENITPPPVHTHRTLPVLVLPC